MDPDRLSDIHIADVVISTAGRDQGKLLYVIETDPAYLTLADCRGTKTRWYCGVY